MVNIRSRAPWFVCICAVQRVNNRPTITVWSGHEAARASGRRSLDALRVGVLVLDAEDRPVLGNPAAHEMGLLRPGLPGTPAVAHTLIRTLAGQARRTGTHREVELDMARGRDQEPLGVHIRAVALGDGHVTIEALDVTESHRLTRVRRDFVANVSHELKTPVGALQLLAEALGEAMDDGRRRSGRGEAVRRADPARVHPARPARHRTAGTVPAAGRRSDPDAGAGQRRPGRRRGDRPVPYHRVGQEHRGRLGRRARPDASTAARARWSRRSRTWWRTRSRTRRNGQPDVAPPSVSVDRPGRRDECRTGRTG